MSISFRPLVYDKTDDLYRCVRESDTDPDAWEISVSSFNGLDILAALGLEPVSCGQLPLETFGGLLTASLRRHLDNLSPAIETHTEASPGRLTIIHCGRREGYVEARLDDLARLILRSRTVGATHFGWG